MKHTNCPICYEELEVVDTTPCIDCGHPDRSLDILKQDIDVDFAHDSVSYTLYRAFEKYECVLCDLCTLEFTSYDPMYFGFDKGVTLWPSNFQFLKQVENPEVGKDKFCTGCGHRLAFLLFVLKLRVMNKKFK